jgi:SAM-dependent methyltransferase
MYKAANRLENVVPITLNHPPNSLAADEDFFGTPILILNFNQSRHLEKQLNWLLTAGYRNLVVIDNGSTYQPVLDYYDSLSTGPVHIMRLDRNFGKFALWEANVLETLRIIGPFVYTDSDVVPEDSCPKDLVGYLATQLRRFPQIFKAGPGLRIDDLPHSYKHHKEAHDWELKFWRKPVARGLFLAAIDTTFALYRPMSAYAQEPALRSCWPYLARHEPWYVDSANLSEEERNYAATSMVTNWTGERVPEWLYAEMATRRWMGQRLLHLGCGHDLFPGWINVDLSPSVRPDIIFDLDNCREQKLPLEDGTVDAFYMCHTFEHIDDTLAMMQELHRVARPGARFVIRLPFGGTDHAFEDPAHKRPYFPNSFVYFAQPAYSRADPNYLGDWRIKRINLVVPAPTADAEPEPALLERIRRERNIVQEMIVELEAVKPARAREERLLEWASPRITNSAIDMESAFF